MGDENVITSNSQILEGTPCFAGTRVPVSSLFDHLASGYTIDHFVTEFPRVTREQAQAVLELVKEMLPDKAERVA